MLPKIILASQSPRRKQLLEWAEVSFDIIVKETNESYPADLPTDEIAMHIARNKALAVQQSNFITIPILAADTIVVLGNEIIGKPKGREDAIDILTRLAGKQHHVITGVVILHAGKEIAFADKTEVTFHPLTKEQIEFYIDKYKPYDKAGAYAIQEWIGVVGIKSVTGDFYNVMGLPVSRVIQSLRQIQK
ncbi:MAG TPA: Maf family protein [Ferruginibacter sp.]|jgi:septum formation protein|nr:Maf family protein [Ferruginibacter sp.]